MKLFSIRWTCRGQSNSPAVVWCWLSENCLLKFPENNIYFSSKNFLLNWSIRHVERSFDCSAKVRQVSFSSLKTKKLRKEFDSPNATSPLNSKNHFSVFYRKFFRHNDQKFLLNLREKTLFPDVLPKIFPRTAGWYFWQHCRNCFRT